MLSVLQIDGLINDDGRRSIMCGQAASLTSCDDSRFLISLFQLAAQYSPLNRIIEEVAAPRARVDLLSSAEVARAKRRRASPPS